jgi:hypothetical protein
MKTFIVKQAGIDLTNRSILLEQVYPYDLNEGSFVMDEVPEENRETNEEDHNACILFNANGETATILNGGFHLFVPDMHDDPARDNSQKMLKPISENLLQSKWKDGEVPMSFERSGQKYTNYVLTYSTAKAGWDESDPTFPGNWSGSAIPDAGGVGFYRVQPAGVTSSGHQAYLPFLTDDVKPNSGSNNSNFFSIVFGDEDTNAISNPTVVVTNGEPVYYNLQGQKLNGQPTQRGVYIVNGKKITVK